MHRGVRHTACSDERAAFIRDLFSLIYGNGNEPWAAISTSSISFCGGGGAGGAAFHLAVRVRVRDRGCGRGCADVLRLREREGERRERGHVAKRVGEGGCGDY